MKKINLPLILGLILLVFLTMIYFFPEKLSTKDPFEIVKYKTYNSVENGKETQRVELPPISPNDENIFGTNKVGHDLYARLLYGTKATLDTVLLAVIIRFALAIVFGTTAGMGGKVPRFIVKVFSTVFTAIPALIFSYLILSINYIQELQTEQSIIAYAFVLTIVGWGKLAKQIQDRTGLIMNEDFIEGEIALGKSKVKIMMQNVIPHLMPSLVVLVFLEAGLVLFLLTQLAVLNAYIGPPIVYRTLSGAIDYIAPSEAAWNNELFYGLRGIRDMQKYYYWVLLYPALAIFTGILAFNLTGEGLRIEFEKRTSRVISFIRRTALFLSPRLYIEQIRKFKKYYKPVLIKTLCMIVLLVSAFAPASKSIYEFSTEESLKHVMELDKEEYEGRMTGYDGGYQAGEYIINTLKSYGIQPYDGENYTQEFSVFEKTDLMTERTKGYVLIKEAEILLKNENGETEKYELGKDFCLAAIKEEYVLDDYEEQVIEFTGKTITEEGLQAMPENSQEEFILVDEVEKGNSIGSKIHRNYTNPNFTTNEIAFFADDGQFDGRMPCLFNKFSTYIVPFDKLKEKITTGSYAVTIKIKKPDYPKHPSRNIFGVLPGKDWYEQREEGKSKRVIMIGASYDSLGLNGLTGRHSSFDITSTAVNLEIARTLSKLGEELDETIIFAFWDSMYPEYRGSLHYSVSERLFKATDYDIIYFDIGNISDDSVKKIKVLIDKHQLMDLDQSFEIIQNVKETLKKRKINHVVVPETKGYVPYFDLFTSTHMRVRLDALGTSEKLFAEDDDIENISMKNMKTIGQFIIDMITIDGLFK